MSVSIYSGKVYDDDKNEFLTCPFNKHEYCRVSCAMICRAKESTAPDAKDILLIGCACQVQRVIISKELQ